MFNLSLIRIKINHRVAKIHFFKLLMINKLRIGNILQVNVAFFLFRSDSDGSLGNTSLAFTCGALSILYELCFIARFIRRLLTYLPKLKRSLSPNGHHFRCKYQKNLFSMNRSK